MSKTTYIKHDEFVEVANKCYQDVSAIQAEFASRNIEVGKPAIRTRLNSYRAKGALPISSGNSVSPGEILKKTSTLYDENGNIKLQWVSSERDKEDYLKALQETITDLVSDLPTAAVVPCPSTVDNENWVSLYISNDVHFGALMWDEESGDDYDTEIATTLMKQAYDNLFAATPSSPIGIIADLGK